jgi:hypothetical protein
MVLLQMHDASIPDFYVLAKANSEQFANHTSDPQRQCERHNYLMV